MSRLKCLVFGLAVIALVLACSVMFLSEPPSTTTIKIIEASTIRENNNNYMAYVVRLPTGEPVKVMWLLGADYWNPRPPVQIGKFYTAELDESSGAYSIRDYRRTWYDEVLVSLGGFSGN